MKAGRDLDRLVAEKVMGLEVHKQADVWLINSGTGKAVPHYSTDIAAAWKVVEKLHAQAGPEGWEVTINLQNFEPNTAEPFNGWIVTVGCETARASSAPLAICIAALLAVGVGGDA